MDTILVEDERSGTSTPPSSVSGEALVDPASTGANGVLHSSLYGQDTILEHIEKRYLIDNFEACE
jgi:hypothetical protein